MQFFDLQIPFLIVQLIQASVSLTRLNDFLNAEEIDKKAIGHETSSEDAAIESKNASFTWDASHHIPTLSNLNLHVKKSSSVAIVGQVGSGKSSLLGTENNRAKIQNRIIILCFPSIIYWRYDKNGG